MPTAMSCSPRSTLCTDIPNVKPQISGDRSVRNKLHKPCLKSPIKLRVLKPRLPGGEKNASERWVSSTPITTKRATQILM